MNFSHSPRSLMMIRPAAFGFNPETAVSNVFQQKGTADPESVSGMALKEFDRMVELLMAHEIDVNVFEDSRDVIKPDAVFPNNWISFHEDGLAVLYPMMAESRRKERRTDIIDKLAETYVINETLDLSSEESDRQYLEGTGSLVFDHANCKVYACRSARTSDKLVKKLAARLAYSPVIFDAVDEKDLPIYHTNVMMSIGKKFVVICLDSIKNEADQDLILDNFSASGHQVISISFQQMNSFAGNLLEVEDKNGDAIVIISEAATKSMLPGQLNTITRFADLLQVNVQTIEKFGGGSVRCMLCGVHLQKRK
jgi:hypothetical protein